jgi:hypothetical protein
MVLRGDGSLAADGAARLPNPEYGGARFSNPRIGNPKFQIECSRSRVPNPTIQNPELEDERFETGA